MIPSDVLFYTSIFLMCYVSLCVSKDDDKHRCKILVSWSLKNFSLTFNETGILTKSDGTQQEVKTEIIKPGVINVTVFEVRCCDGFFENEKHRCKKCPYNTYGNNCTGVCKCEGYRKCDHMTGKCIKCVTKPCEESSGVEIVTPSDSTTHAVVTTISYYETTSFTEISTDTEPSTSETTEMTQVANCTGVDCSGIKDGHVANCTGVDCSGIKDGHANCTGVDCSGIKDGHGDKTYTNKDDDHTVLIAVILSLGLSTFVLVVCIVARERYHRSRKRKKQKSGQLPSKDDVADYVDPEPFYFEIKDADVIRDSKLECKPNPPERSKNGNSYVIQNYSDNQRNNNDSEECGYLNPYTGLRFTRSETNIYRDRKAREKGEYDVIYSVAKSIHRSESDIESNETRDETNALMEGEAERISKNVNRVSGEDHAYFVLEKVNQEPESQDTEREKLLSRRSRSSV